MKKAPCVLGAFFIKHINIQLALCILSIFNNGIYDISMFLTTRRDFANGTTASCTMVAKKWR